MPTILALVQLNVRRELAPALQLAVQPLVLQALANAVPDPIPGVLNG